MSKLGFEQWCDMGLRHKLFSLYYDAPRQAVVFRLKICRGGRSRLQMACNPDRATRPIVAVNAFYWTDIHKYRAGSLHVAQTTLAKLMLFHQ